MENVSEFIYEVIAVIILCLGVALFYNISTNATQASTNVAQETRNKTNVKEGDHGYKGDNTVDAASVYFDIIESDGEVTVIIRDGRGKEQEVPAAEIEEAQLQNNAALITKYLNMSREYEKEYVAASNGQATIVRYKEVTS